EKIHRRSMIVLFTDMFQNQDENELFKALQHLKHNKHKVIVFHVYSREHELNINFDNSTKKFIDIERGAEINLFADNIKADYQKAVKNLFKKMSLACAQYRNQYVPVAVRDMVVTVLLTYLTDKQKFS